MPVSDIDLLQHYNIPVDKCKRRFLGGHAKLSVCGITLSGCRLCPITFEHNKHLIMSDRNGPRLVSRLYA